MLSTCLNWFWGIELEWKDHQSFAKGSCVWPSDARSRPLSCWSWGPHALAGGPTWTHCNLSGFFEVGLSMKSTHVMWILHNFIVCGTLFSDKPVWGWTNHTRCFLGVGAYLLWFPHCQLSTVFFLLKPCRDMSDQHETRFSMGSP